jgi:probable phosphoglycerate mutase
MSPTPVAAPSDDEEFTEVVVVRHGETSGNTSRILQVGRPPPDSLCRPFFLNANGRFY